MGALATYTGWVAWNNFGLGLGTQIDAQKITKKTFSTIQLILPFPVAAFSIPTQYRMHAVIAFYDLVYSFFRICDKKHTGEEDGPLCP